ncbi:hypothetical protein EV360DRAFT_70083 [Lentinula raphanica]|nr:hypothetical protein EV360DRAFT_70083 [Lentinula raphanica]
MIQGRSKTSSRSTAFRRARLAVFVLSAVLSSNVLAAPTIRPRALTLSFSEPDSAPTQTSSGPGSLSGGGRGDWDLGRVDYSPVVLRQDVDGLQTFDDPADVKDSSGSDLNLSVSAKSERSVDLSKRGGCLSCIKKPELGATQNTGTAQDPTAHGDSQHQHAEAIDEERRRLEQELESNAKEFKKIKAEVSQIHTPGFVQQTFQEQQPEYARLGHKYQARSDEMFQTACKARDMGIDVGAHGGVHFEQYDSIHDEMYNLVKLAESFSLGPSQISIVCCVHLILSILATV